MLGVWGVEMKERGADSFSTEYGMLQLLRRVVVPNRLSVGEAEASEWQAASALLKCCDARMQLRYVLQK